VGVGGRIPVPPAVCKDIAMTKTLTFAIVHFAVAFTVGYVLTGSVVIGGLLALIEPACNTVAYHLHEKAWAGWERRRRAAGGPEARAGA
jgi:uncharacterized membrane protein